MKIEEYLSSFQSEIVNIFGPMLKKIPEIDDPIIYVDGGANFKIADRGISLGDNDSYTGKLDHILPTEKEFSDLSFALKHCQKFNQVKLYGFLGGRRDHELMNMGEVHHFLAPLRNKKVLFDHEIISLSKGKFSIKHDGLFSIFVFESVELTLSGDVKFTVKNNQLKPFSSQGLSNESTGDIHIETSGPCFIFLI